MTSVPAYEAAQRILERVDKSIRRPMTSKREASLAPSELSECGERRYRTNALPRIVMARRYALLFGDGRQGFPRAELLGAGVPEVELDRLREGWLARELVGIARGRERSLLAELPPDREVEMTWRETIGDFIGEPHASLFRGLGRYGRDEDLRILSRRG